MNWVLKDKTATKLESLNMTGNKLEYNQPIAKNQLADRVKNRMQATKQRYKVAPLKNIPKSISTKSGFGKKFTTKTSSYPKFRGLSSAEKTAISNKQKNSTKLTNNIKNRDNDVESRFLKAKSNFKDSSRLEVSDTMKAVKQFLGQDETENVNTLLAVSEYDEMQAFYKPHEEDMERESKVLITQNMVDVMDGVMDKFMTFDFGSIEFSDDSEFVKQSPKLLEVVRMVESLEVLSKNVSDYFMNLDKEQYDAFKEKFDYGVRVKDYFYSQTDLINDDYYKNHANSELTILNNQMIEDRRQKAEKEGNQPINDNTDVQKAFLGKLWKRELYKKAISVEHGAGYKEFLKGFSPNENVTDYIFDPNRSFVSKDIMDAYDRSVERLDIIAENEYSSSPFSLATPFLKFLGVFSKEKRTDNHGIKNPFCVAGKQQFLPKELYSGNFVVQKGTQGKVPPVNVTKYLADMKKRGYLEVANSLLGLNICQVNDQARNIVSNLIGYSQLQMFYNKDIFEMEMYYLDSFLKESEAFINSAGNTENNLELARFVNEITRIKNELAQNGSGGLEDWANHQLDSNIQERYYKAKNSLVGLYDQHGIKDNMKESNVKDIPLFTHEPCIEDIMQGEIGDCWLMAGLQTVVMHDPSIIKNMFQDLGDGTVMVKLYVPVERDIIDGSTKVQAGQTDRIIGGYEPRFVKLVKHYETGSNGATGCIWTQLIEKAFTALNINYKHGGGSVKGDEIREVTSHLTDGTGMSSISGVYGSAPFKYDFLASDLSDPDKVTNYVNTMKTYFQNNRACSVELSGHVITAIDAQMMDGEAYLLIRDTFNVFNKTYTTEDNKTKTSGDGLSQTIFDNGYMNKVSQESSKNLDKAHRGLSWWKLSDLVNSAYTDKLGRIRCFTFENLNPRPVNRRVVRTQVKQVKIEDIKPQEKGGLFDDLEENLIDNKSIKKEPGLFDEFEEDIIDNKSIQENVQDKKSMGQPAEGIKQENQKSVEQPAEDEKEIEADQIKINIFDDSVIDDSGE